MSIWGFSIPEDRIIDYDRNDRSMAETLLREVPGCRLCIGCGGCTATCTAGSSFNIRRLQMLVRRGETAEARRDLDQCRLCGKCILVCPRGVDTRRMILSMLRYLDRHHPQP